MTRRTPGGSLIIVLVAGLGSLVACTVTRSGILADMANQRSIPISVVIRGDSAEVTGVDSATGETLTGILLVDDENPRPGTDLGGVTPPVGGGSAGGPGGTAPIGVGRAATTSLSMVGTLHGDLGTTLRCVVEIQQRLRLAGEGVCSSARAGSDARYVLRF